MASTNKTTNYELSQYVSSDKPTYLIDYNSDMSKIDTGIHTAKTTADGAATAAGNAQTAAEGAQTTANTAVTNAATAQTAADSANTKIGALADLTTTEKTNIVGAVNEVNSKANSIVSTVEVASDTKAYSTNYSDSHYKLKHEHLEKLLFEGTTASGNSSQINTTWAALGIFGELIVEIFDSGTNLNTTAVFQYDQLSSGDDLYSGRLTTNVAQICIAPGSTVGNVYLLPNTYIGSNTIKFDLPSGMVVKRIFYVE